MEKKWWYRLLRWFAGFFEDQKGNPSSKRAIAYAVIYILANMTEYSLQLNVKVDPYVLGVFLLIELVSLGVIGSEFFLKNGIPGVLKDKSNEETTDSKQE